MDTSIDQNERIWAAIAHGSAVVTLFLALSTAGTGTLAGVLVPLVIYLAYNNKSRYVTYHALQALAFQTVVIVGSFAVGLLGGGLIAVVWVVTVLLMSVLVGFLLLPISIGLTALIGMAIALFPFAAAAYAMVGSYKTYSGEVFDYAYIGDAVKAHAYPATVTPAAEQPTEATPAAE